MAATAACSGAGSCSALRELSAPTNLPGSRTLADATPKPGRPRRKSARGRLVARSCTRPRRLPVGVLARLPFGRHRPNLGASMFTVDEATADAIRRAYGEGGELSGIVEFRRHFPLITDHAKARECVQIIAGSEAGACQEAAAR